MAPLGKSKTLTAQFLQRNVSIKDELRRGPDGDLGEAGGRVARLGSVADRPEVRPSATRFACRRTPRPARAGLWCAARRWNPRGPHRNFTILRHAIDFANLAEKALMPA